jgi:transcriptional regulator with XRE-family HTH domain
MRKDDSDFSYRLIMAMMAEGMTPGQLAERSVMEPSAISHYLAGRREPSLANLGKLLKALPNCDARQLVTDIHETEPEQSTVAGGRAEPLVGRRSLLAADALAREVARLIDLGVIDMRAMAADALMDYLDVGSPGGPETVPQWTAQYDERHG